MHRVKSGDTLWGISKHYFGQGHLWPSIYAYNNATEIVRQRGGRLVNPNLIHPGEIIFLPPLRPHMHPYALSAPAPQAAVAAKPSIAIGRPTASPPKVNPAETIAVPDFPFRFSFPDQELYSVEGPGWRATAKLVGSVLLQRNRKVALVTYSDKGAETSAKVQANIALSQLTSEAKISFDAASGTIKFENSMTTRAGANGPGTKVTWSVGPDGKPVGKASILFPTLKGRMGDYAYVSGDLRVDLEITFNDQQRTKEQTAPATQFAPAGVPQSSGLTKNAQPGVAGNASQSPPSSGALPAIPTGAWGMIGMAVMVGVVVVFSVGTGGVADAVAAFGLAAVGGTAGMGAMMEKQRLEPGT
ncbi:MAG: LysM domain-containing protein [Telmatospirillum sp.]|nr:LysM domain-containing protein [Telmatospirillum sp.]MDR3435253.1 LysM domain-containing protein [Telmatospirillum sp.]